MRACLRRARRRLDAPRAQHSVAHQMVLPVSILVATLLIDADRLLSVRATSDASLLASRPAAHAYEPYVVTPEQHGARGDGHADDTGPIRAAVASCTGHTKCRVVFAKNYISGPFTLNSSGTSLEITGRLAALPRVSGCTSGNGCYPRDGAAQATWPAFINSHGLHDITVSGGGTIDFGGAPWWPCKHTGCWRPHLLNFTHVRRLLVEDIELVDPANHFIRVTDCSHVRIERVT